jgi:RsiW-degrading membrane proteinase PrsW (M82 family)
MDIVFLLILALLPGIILLYFILFMDREEKEPLGLVLLMMLLGALSIVPAAIMEGILGLLPIYSGGTLSNAITRSFVMVAWVEELAKLSVVLLFAWKNKNFNEPNDGIVYVGASALGFAMLENVFYVLSHGIAVGILRAITAMPSHCFTGVLMGYYVGQAKFAPNREERKRNILKGFFLAYVLHGTYDALIFTKTPAALLIFPMVIGVTVFGIKFMRKGRALSIAHAAAAPAVTPDTSIPHNIYIQQELLVRTNPKNQLWKIIISRTLLTLSGLFWGLLIIGITAAADEFKAEIAEAILGGIILSFLPILIGVVLEISYRRKKKFFKQLQVSPQVLRQPPVEGIISPPRQLWKAVIARTLLTISGFFWALVILGAIAAKETDISEILLGLLGAGMISFLPILTGVLLEISYRKKRKEFRYAYQTAPTVPTAPSPSMEPPPPFITDDELHAYCQQLKQKRKKEG